MQIPFKKDPIEFNQRAVFATNVFVYYRPIMRAMFTRTYLNNLTHQALRRNSAFVVRMRIIQG